MYILNHECILKLLKRTKDKNHIIVNVTGQQKKKIVCFLFLFVSISIKQFFFENPMATVFLSKI